MSAIDQIIARGFNFDPVGSFRRGRDKRHAKGILDEAARREEELYNRKLEAYDASIAQEEEQKTALSELLDLSGETSEVLGAQQDLMSNVNPSTGMTLLEGLDQQRKSIETAQDIALGTENPRTGKTIEQTIAEKPDIPTDEFPEGERQHFTNVMNEMLDRPIKELDAVQERASEYLMRPLRDLSGRKAALTKRLIMSNPSVRKSYIEKLFAGETGLPTDSMLGKLIVLKEKAVKLDYPPSTVAQIDARIGKEIAIQQGMEMTINPDGTFKFSQGGSPDGKGGKTDYRAWKREISQTARSSALRLGKLNLYEQISEGVTTGVGTEFVTRLKSLAQTFGVDLSAMNIKDDVGVLNAMQSLSTDFALDQISRTKGAISEREMDLFVASVPSLSNTPKGNKIILKVMRAVAERDIVIQKMAVKYVLKHGELNIGFEDELDEYGDNNPIFSGEEFAWLEDVVATGSARDQPAQGIPGYWEMTREKQQELNEMWINLSSEERDKILAEASAGAN